MKRPSLKGMKHFEYLGHFAQDKYIQMGHNESEDRDDDDPNKSIREEADEEVKSLQAAYRENARRSVEHSMSKTGEPFSPIEKFRDSTFKSITDPIGVMFGVKNKVKYDYQEKIISKKLAEASERKKLINNLSDLAKKSRKEWDSKFGSKSKKGKRK